jgi:hypothetical protein
MPRGPLELGAARAAPAAPLCSFGRLLLFIRARFEVELDHGG